jgi:hypothetical protein
VVDRHTVVTATAEAMSYARRTESHLLLFLALGDPSDRAKFFKRRTSLDEQVATLLK